MSLKQWTGVGLIFLSGLLLLLKVFVVQTALVGDLWGNFWQFALSWFLMVVFLITGVMLLLLSR